MSSETESLVVFEISERVEHERYQGASRINEPRSSHTRKLLNWWNTGSWRWKIILIATTVGLLSLLLVIDALNSHDFLVDDFDSAPELSARGLSGHVVALHIRGSWQEIEHYAQLMSAQIKYTAVPHNGGTPLSSILADVEIPKTGVHLDLVRRALHDWLSNDSHIEGDLVELPNGRLSLTVRAGLLPQRTYRGADADELTRNAAEYLYSSMNPVRFAHYLWFKGSVDRAHQKYWNERLTTFRTFAMANVQTNVERSALINLRANVLQWTGDIENAVKTYRVALRFDPNNWRAMSNLIATLPEIEGDESAWRVAHQMTEVYSTLKRSNTLPSDLRLFENAGQLASNLPLLVAASEDGLTYFRSVGRAAHAHAVIADAYAQQHDFARANDELNEADPTDNEILVETRAISARWALENNKPDKARLALTSLNTLLRDHPNVHSVLYTDSERRCLSGLVLRYGPEADAQFMKEKMGAPKSALCSAVYGDMLASRGDRKGAETAWKKGASAFPDLAVIYLHRGADELKHRQGTRALRDFALAHDKAPEFADPLKLWGDALASQNHWSEALHKYDEATPFAPAWPALLQAKQMAKQMCRCR